MGARRVRIFKIQNRKGFACICSNHLTEGKAPLEAYRRMRKALKRRKVLLKELCADALKKYIVDL